MNNNFPSVSLRLNMQVLAELFPEGSQARVDLTNAILNEAAKHYIKGALTAEVKGYIDQITAKASENAPVEALMRGNFERQGTYWHKLAYHVNKGGALHETIGQAVKDAFSDTITAYVRESVADAIANYRDKVAERVDYELRQRMDQITRAEVQKRVSDALIAAGLAAK